MTPPAAQVREARRQAGTWRESSGGEARYDGIVHALDWVAAVRPDSPATAARDEPTSSRVLVEILAVEQAFRREPRTRGDAPRRSAVEDEEQMERLGHGIHVAAALLRNESGRLHDRDIRFLEGIADTLRWLIGEIDRPPISLPIRE